jgi:hypothetical protein
MKLIQFLSFSSALLLLAGCAETPETSENHLRLGLSREQLRERFGEPLRIESHGGDGEDWYYYFVSWDTHPSQASDASNDFGQRTTSGSLGIQFERSSEDLPVRISADGHVIAPLPQGKVVIN